MTLLIGWQEGYPACKKSGCWFVGGDDLTGALHVLQLQLSPPSPWSLAQIKCRMETLWYRLTQVPYIWKMAVQMGKKSERDWVCCRSKYNIIKLCQLMITLLLLITIIFNKNTRETYSSHLSDFACRGTCSVSSCPPSVISATQPTSHMNDRTTQYSNNMHNKTVPAICQFSMANLWRANSHIITNRYCETNHQSLLLHISNAP